MPHGHSPTFFSTWRLNFSQTEICTAKPMVVGCVQPYSTHFINKLGKSLEPFFHKVQKNVKKMAKNADFSKISNCIKKRRRHV